MRKGRLTMRSIWSGALSFGLIYIPIKLYDATQSHTIDFDLLRRSDHCRIHYAKVCRETGEEIPKEQIVRGYQYRKGEYVVVEDDDFKRANVSKTQTVEIVCFVEQSQVAHKYMEKPYYVEPVKEAKKAYVLLREAMSRSNKAAVARYVMRRREHMALITPEENVMILNNMRFSDELRTYSELDLPQKGSESVSEKELDMAVRLIEQLSEEWKPEQYKDTYYEELKTVLQQKIEGRIPQPEKPQPAPAAVTDLFSRLSESLKVAEQREKKAA